MEERAIVKRVVQGGVFVESQVKSTCSQCEQIDNCGTGIVAKAIPHKSLSLLIDTEQSYAVGDEVIISIPESAILTVAWQVYLLPLIGLIGAGAIGQYFVTHLQWFNHEWPAILMSFGGGYIGYRVAKLIQNKSNANQALTPKIMQKVIQTKAV